jgi:4-diphosphocytidyl-2-C-methyl-D-erythritol kinase
MFLKRLNDDTLIIGAPAKINLFLEVLDKRPDGYHNINSLFQAVSLFDRLTFTKSSKPGIRIEIAPESAIRGLSVDTDNLVARAYRAVSEAYPNLSGVSVRLEKNIPMAAGLGGGSSDAAATIIALSELFQLNIPQHLMASIGLSVGSDVPFFFSGGQAMVSGRGEVCHPTHFPTDYWAVLVTPALAISTAEAYQRLSEHGLTNPKSPFMLGNCQSVDEFLLTLKLAGNDFEKIHLRFFPELVRIKDELSRCGAILVRMSGSGPAFAGLFRDAPPPGIDSVGAGRDWQVHTVRPVVYPVSGSQQRGGDRGDYRDSGHPQE